MRMKSLVLVAAVAVAALFVTAATASAAPQVGVEVGVAPDCPYGYYDVPPYACAPYGYYRPEWFTGGVFIGAGPWYQGRAGFWGHVDNRFHPDHGYHGHMPDRGEKRDEANRVDRMPTSTAMKCATGTATRGAEGPSPFPVAIPDSAGSMRDGALFVFAS